MFLVLSVHFLLLFLHLPSYYDLLKDGQVVLDGIPVLKEVCLIPFKAKAWLDLNERKENGGSVDSKNIKKHKNDVFRLGQLITEESRQVLDEEIEVHYEDVNKYDMHLFLFDATLK